jgi:hypothetical protein
MLQGFMARALLLPVRPFNSNGFPTMKLLALFLFAALAGCATKNIPGSIGKITPASTAAPTAPDPAAIAAVRAEEIRTDCINGRRLVCGKVLKIFPGGLVVDSGYTDLLRKPLTESWVVPGSVSASRDPAVLELNEPRSPCIGLVFLTDIPKRRKVKIFDYVVIMGYPAGQYVYAPAPNVDKTIRKFSCGLDTAVRLKLQAEENKAVK